MSKNKEGFFKKAKTWLSKQFYEQEEYVEPILEFDIEPIIELEKVEPDNEDQIIEEVDEDPFKLALSEINAFYTKSKKAYREREVSIRKGEDEKTTVIENELPFRINLDGFKLSIVEVSSTIYIDNYSNHFMGNTPITIGKMIKAIKDRLDNIVNKYDDVTIEYPFVDMEDYNEDEELEDVLVRQANNLAEYKIKKRKEQITLSHSHIFDICHITQRPTKFSFIPDISFKKVYKKHLNQTYREAFDNYYDFRHGEVTIYNTKGKIDYYDDPKMNEAIVYLVNLLAEKCYFVDEYPIPPVLEKLMLFGTPKTNAKEQVELGVDLENPVEDVDSIFVNNKFKTYFKMYDLAVDAKEFTTYLITHFKFMSSYNYHKKGGVEAVRHDSNKLKLVEVMTKYCTDNGLGKDSKGLFLEYTFKAKEDLVEMYLLLFSEYYNIYHSQNIDDHMFTKKQGETKGDDKAKVKPA